MKRQMRSHMKRTLAEIPTAAILAQSDQACRTICGMEEFTRAKVIMSYLPMPREVDTSTLNNAVWASGRTLLVPKVQWEAKTLLALLCHPQEKMVPSRYGILEPVEGDSFPLDKIDFIIVPGLAFDDQGRRIGRGMGFYDRFLSSAGTAAFRCGLALHQQVVPAVPVGPTDQNVHALATDHQLLRFNRI